MTRVWNCCRYCGKGEENGYHLIACPELPDHLRATKQAIADAIAREAGNIPHHATRKGNNIISLYIISFDWPHQTQRLLKRLLVFCRNLLNQYAAHKPEKWKEETLASYPVRRVRPLHRKVARDSP